MEDNKGLKILSEILSWDEDMSRREFAWLKMMAAIKYDDYRDFLPGMRFLENLAAWLQQFELPEERKLAYSLLRKRLIYVSHPEMQRLVELSYYNVIERRLIQIVAQRRGIPLYQVRVNADAMSDLKRLRRRSLILGLSDGARLDILRHSTTGLLVNDQFAIQTQLDHVKWKSMVKALRDAQGDPDAAFEVVFLLDDFMGTGTSFLRFDKEKKQWTGKLNKFMESIATANENCVSVLSPGVVICVHHYLATAEAASKVPEHELKARDSGQLGLQAPSNYTFGAVISPAAVVATDRLADAALVALAKKYYSNLIETRHTEVGGAGSIALGYGSCGLPLVLHHNTPNNSLPLLWAEAAAGLGRDKVPQREMRPLFRRRQRHGDDA